MRILWIGLRALAYAAVLVSLFGLVAFSIRDMDAQLGLDIPAGMRTMGAVFMVVGGGLALLCVFVFVTHGEGTPAPFDPPRKFVAHGPYRWVRNPMLIGVTVLVFGVGLWNQSVSIVLFGVVIAVGIHLFIVLIEEPGLELRFGSDYNEYRAEVNRYIPKRRRESDSRI